MLDQYFDLRIGDLKTLSIKKKDSFSCQIVDTSGKSYLGFLLAQSDSGSAYTICDMDFHPNADDKFQPRPTFRRTNKELQDKKVGAGSQFQRITFQSGDDGYNEFWKMVDFLQSFKGLVDTGDFGSSFKIIGIDDFIVCFSSKEDAEKISDISKLINIAELSPDELKNLSRNLIHKQRQESLIIFGLLLENKDYYIEKYKTSFGIKENGEEPAWHHFLKTNPWILGLNLDIKFIKDFISEANVGVPNTTGKGAPEVDLIGYSDYTILVELKTANKKIFTDTKGATSRSNTWSFSSDFIDGISQCLAQKTEWDKHTKSLIKDGEVINENITRTVDSDCIFIIGNKSIEIPEDSSSIDIQIKRDTFQRFRVNMKNIKIITFDELYQRACKIIDM